MKQESSIAAAVPHRRVVPIDVGHEDPEDGKREYVVQWCHGEPEEGETWNEYSIWAHTGADAMRDCYERHDLNITVIVCRPHRTVRGVE